MSDPTRLRGIVICRQASDYRKPGHVTGFACKVCGKPLQGSAAAQQQIAAGVLMPLCNPCGFAMQKRLEDSGAAYDVLFSPEAASQLEEMLAEMRRSGNADRAE